MSSFLAEQLSKFTRQERDAIANHLTRLANKEMEPEDPHLGLCREISLVTDHSKAIEAYGVMNGIGERWPFAGGDAGFPIAGRDEPTEGMWDFRTKNGKRRRDFARFAAAFWQHGDQE